MSAPLQRKLAGILYADVAGYSRLTGADEDGTHRALSGHLDCIARTVQDHSGSVVHYAGDAVLADFPTASDALRCAVAVQSEIARRDDALPEESRVRFRIGVNLGEVIVDRDDIYGDGVNIAARLEALAEAGGVCVSGTVYDAVGNKLPLAFRFLGEQRVKNIERPVRAYQVLAQAGPCDPKPSMLARRHLTRSLVAALAVLLAVFAIVGWWLLREMGTPAVEPAPVAVTAPEPAPALLSLPAVQAPVDTRKSIAVLPFSNLGGDPEQEYFIDGVTNDLITDLSQMSNLLVIASNSVFTYKGTAVKVQQVAAELGVEYVLEGSVQRSGNRVRVNAQLVEADTGHHVWAERFDAQLTDILTLQDQVSRRIVSALAVELTADEDRRRSTVQRVDPEAYDTLLRGLELFRRFTRENNIAAREYFERAVAIDPDFARAHADIALSYAQDLQFGWLHPGTPEYADAMARAFEHGRRALAIDDRLREVHFALTSLYASSGQTDKAIEHGYESVRVDPNYADGYANLAQALVYAGRPQEALRHMATANRLNPRGAFFYEWIEGHAHMLLGDYQRAIEAFQNVIARNPGFPGAHVTLAATLGNLGRIDDAEWQAGEVLTLLPHMSLARERERRPYTRDADMDWYLEGLRRAGVPE